ncbi:MAG TPA: hypothetical protein VJG32_14590 [Anaerolineae bacterium]|nr:hypothetical protein [Anaerolineae bacterium]
MGLLHRLNTLESTGLIRLATAQPDLEYLFRHALVQDAAYSSLVKQDRRRLHRAVGEALERMYPDRVDTLAPLLAQHFDAAGERQRALKYFTLAGDQAARQYANAEAGVHYTRALELARAPLTLPDLEVDRLVHLYVGLGRVLQLSGRHEAALATYAEMESLARARGDRSLELAALMERATVHATLTPLQDAALAGKILKQALALAQALGDRQAEAKVYWNLMLVELYGGTTYQAVAYGEKSLALARRLGMREQLAFTLNDLGTSYLFVGQVKRGWAALREVSELWRELGNLPMLSDSLSNSTLVCNYLGEYDEALRLGQEAVQISQSIGNRWGQSHALGMLGYTYQEIGWLGDTVAAWESSVQLGGESGLTSTQIGIRADLAWVYGYLGMREHALELARLALDQADMLLPMWRPWAVANLARLLLLNGEVAAAENLLRTGCQGRVLDHFSRLLISGAVAIPLAQGELALARQDAARAISLMEELLTHLRNIGVQTFVADALHLKGRAFQAQGEVDRAYATLAEGRAQAESLGSRRSLWPILVALSEVEAQRGNRMEAQALRDQARAIIEYIAGHIQAPDLRASFLARPDLPGL